MPLTRFALAFLLPACPALGLREVIGCCQAWAETNTTDKSEKQEKRNVTRNFKTWIWKEKFSILLAMIAVSASLTAAILTQEFTSDRCI